MVTQTNNLKKIIKKFLVKLEEKGIQVHRIYLYGSYANGHPSGFSDIDLAVISPSFNKKNVVKRQELLGEIIYSIGEPIEAIGYSLQEFQKAPAFSFLSSIISHGQIVHRG